MSTKTENIDIASQRPATGDGALDKLLLEYAQERAYWLDAPPDFKEAREQKLAMAEEAITAYVSAAVQEAVKKERDACLQIAAVHSSSQARYICERIRERSLVTAEMLQEKT